MFFATPYKKNKVVFVKNTIGKQVETAGYISAEKRIKNMMDAGQRLIDQRSLYDFGPDDEIDEDYIDPTRERSFDMAEASQIVNSLEDKAKSIKKNAVKQKKDASGEAKPEGAGVTLPPPEKGA